MTQLPFGDEDGVHELQDLGVAGLGIEQDLANEVHMTLHFEGMSLFFSLYYQGGAGPLAWWPQCRVEAVPRWSEGPGLEPLLGAA